MGQRRHGQPGLQCVINDAVLTSQASLLALRVSHRSAQPASPSSCAFAPFILLCSQLSRPCTCLNCQVEDRARSFAPRASIMSLRSVYASSTMRCACVSPLRSRALSSSRTVLNASTSASRTAQNTLSWPEFLRLRTSSRRASTLLSIPTTIAGMMVGGAYFAARETDQTTQIYGLDPLVFNSLATLGCVGAGWLIGRMAGDTLWRVIYRRRLPAFEARERDFAQHIARYRGDPARGSVNKCVSELCAR